MRGGKYLHQEKQVSVKKWKKDEVKMGTGEGHESKPQSCPSGASD